MSPFFKGGFKRNSLFKDKLYVSNFLNSKPGTGHSVAVRAFGGLEFGIYLALGIWCLFNRP